MKTSPYQFEFQAYELSEAANLETVARLDEVTAALQKPAEVDAQPAERGLTSLAEAFAIAGL